MKHKKATRGPGRPAVIPKMPCGWRCGAMLSGDELREHHKNCPNAPAKEQAAPVQATA